MASTAAAPFPGGAREWHTALLTLRDESLASPSPPALLALLRRVLLSPASPSLAASATALSPHEVGSDVAFLAETAAAVSHCAGADDVLRGFCHLIHDITCKTNMEIDSSCLLAMLKFLDVLKLRLLEGACVKAPSVRTTALDTVSECLQILSVGVLDKSAIMLLVEIALRLAKDGEKVKSNAVRALGYLLRFIRFNNHSDTVDDPRWLPVLCTSVTISFSWLFQLTIPAKDGEKVKSNAVRALGYLLRFIRFNNHSDTVDDPSNSVFCGDPVWLERMVHALISCVTTGNVKVQWNVCHALSNLFMNNTLRLADMPWASSVYSILLLLLRDSNNYKIRMHAAVALAVPVSRLDYDSSFPDVVQGIEHVLETLSSNNLSSPSNFKHRDNLKKQVTFTALHLFGFVSPKDDQSLKGFLIKKASFLEDWLKSLCSLFNNDEDQPLTSEAINDKDGFSPNVAQKVMVSSAVKSLIDVYTSGNQHTVAQRFEQLARSLQ